ncbi:class I SAM-dependent methyltransferase [Novosphingobium sp. JCM 18896]|uniref:class I SAM-dependent methyltransferase n=1 Tax=Novosphingobium sp. JCM 18896 TaxID=2989731 RepID=UPI002222E07C|nr:class I SAM-dependent methyltransferase [Novosphingobium sp. JCM 18896]MCW1431333.1 class I SAM-dependent methyltransferase [Novosphingobium sp. JCM 18896]
MAASLARDHAALMDSVYRGQRHVYDLTRKYYLFGRDRLIAGLDARPGQAVLEIGCGTGRNLAQVAKKWPGAVLHGLDLSSEMLKSARATLGGSALLAQGDATAFCSQALFGRAEIDRTILSYALSMIPDWRAALDQGAAVLAPGGSLHVVDFGDLAGLPAPLRKGLRAWLAAFHVTPRLDLIAAAQDIAAQRGMSCHAQRGPLGYFQQVTLTRGI